MIRFILTVTTILTSSSAICFYLFHQRLSKRITHTTHIGTLAKSAGIECVPDSVCCPKYFTVYDKCTKAVPRTSLPNESPDLLLTRLVRRNMIIFSRFPQALMLSMMSKGSEQKKSFKKAHITSLDFKEGDLVCGVYQVKVRRRDKVEFEIHMHGVDHVEGRLSISFKEIEQDEEDLVMFCSETSMWRRAEEERRMPLERTALRWMHETAAWWLVDSGVKYLMDLE